MAKFNIEVELDWLNEGEGIDEAVYQQVIAGIQNKLSANVEGKMMKELEGKVTEEIDKIVEKLLEKVTVNSLENMVIPHKESSWDSNVKEISLSQYVGMKFEDYISKKSLTKKGNKPSWSDDAVYSVADYLTKNHIAEELNDKVVAMIQTAKKQAEDTLISSLEENLQQQLNADMLKRLNIPALLENLQNTISIEGDK